LCHTNTYTLGWCLCWVFLPPPQPLLLLPPPPLTTFSVEPFTLLLPSQLPIYFPQLRYSFFFFTLLLLFLFIYMLLYLILMVLIFKWVCSGAFIFTALQVRSNQSHGWSWYYSSVKNCFFFCSGYFSFV